MYKKFLPALFLFFAASFFACKKEKTSDTMPIFQTKLARDHDGQIAHEWVNLASEIIKENGISGPQSARIFGYIGLTLHESAVNGIPNGRSLAGQINELPKMPQPKTDQIYEWGLVLCAAMETVMPELFDQISAVQRGSIQSMAAVQTSKMMFASDLTPQIINISKEFGVQIGEKIMFRAKNDGRNTIKNLIATLPARTVDYPQYWDATTLNQVPVEPLWSLVRPLVLPNSQGCEIDPPFSYGTNNNSEFYKNAKEITDFYPLTQQNAAIAYHWENDIGRSSGAAGHWMNITKQILERENLNLEKTCQAYAMTGLTAADCFSVAWFLKYKYNILSPLTYIQEVLNANWISGVSTPAYPTFTSADATIGGAMPMILIKIFGDVSFEDKTHFGSKIFTPDAPNVPKVLPERNFTSFTAAGLEQKEAGIIGGISFRHASEMGYESGRCIGQTILNNIKLTK
jgi:hypothetical protein